MDLNNSKCAYNAIFNISFEIRKKFDDWVQENNADIEKIAEQPESYSPEFGGVAFPILAYLALIHGSPSGRPHAGHLADFCMRSQMKNEARAVLVALKDEGEYSRGLRYYDDLDFLIALIDADTKRFDVALRSIRELQRWYPEDHGKLQYYIGTIEHELGQFAAAEASYRECLDLLKIRSADRVFRLQAGSIESEIEYINGLTKKCRETAPWTGKRWSPWRASIAL